MTIAMSAATAIFAMRRQPTISTQIAVERTTTGSPASPINPKAAAVIIEWRTAALGCPDSGGPLSSTAHSAKGINATAVIRL